MKNWLVASKAFMFTRRVAAADDPRVIHDRLQKLVEASYLLHSTLDLDELLARILKAAADGVGAERGTVFLLDAEKGEIWSRVLSGEERLEIRLPVGKGLAGSVAATGETIRIADAYSDERFDRSWDLKSGFRTKAVLCAPIRNREGAIVGVFQLLNSRDGEFAPDDEEYLAALSANAALAVENAQLHASALEKERYDREVFLAQEVQRALQPEERVVTVGGLCAAGLNELCEDASGDYYDLLRDDGGAWLGVALGDVSGHGLQAALVMTAARAYLRAFVRSAPNPAVAMELVNDFLVPDMVAGKFISLFVAVLDAASGRMDWCNAGQDAGLLVRAGGGIERLGATGHVVGILSNASYKAGEPVIMEKGDLLVLHTDGFTEARNPAGDLFGRERLEEAVLEVAGGSPEEVLADLRARLREWTGEKSLDDDLTVVTVKRTS